MIQQTHGLYPTAGTDHPPAASAPVAPHCGRRREDVTVAIVGGSLVGPAAELFLRRHGLRDVVTYEALPAARSQSGGVMGLRYDTIDLLAQLGVDIPTVKALHDRDVYAYDLTDRGPVRRGVSAFPGMVTSWDALHDQLRRLVAVRTHHRLVGLDVLDGRWRLRFAHRPDAIADVVLFADGRHSTGRTLLDPGRPLRYNGYIVWRGLATPPTPLPRGFERYYDIGHGRLFSITAPLRQSGLCYWELSHNLPEALYTAIAGAGPTQRAFLLPQHIDDPAAGNPTTGSPVSGSPAREIIRDAARYLPDTFQALIAGSEVAGIPVNDTTMPDRALFGSDETTDGDRAVGNGTSGGPVAVLLGDALLPVRLQVGAGLNQGLQQAAELAEALTAPHPAERLREWEHRTLERLAPWVEHGRSRAHRNNLGFYEPVHPGRTTAPRGDQWSEPLWVTA